MLIIFNKNHLVNKPASKTNCEPVINLDLSEAKKITALATSSVSTQGTFIRLPALRSAISFGVDPSNAARPSFIGVLTPVGWMDITLILCGASSIAHDFVKPVNPHLEAA